MTFYQHTGPSIGKATPNADGSVTFNFNGPAPTPCVYCHQDSYGITHTGIILVSHVDSDCPGAFLDKVLWGSWFTMSPVSPDS